MRTYRAIDGVISRLLGELGAEKTPAVQGHLDDLSILILYGMGFDRTVQ